MIAMLITAPFFLQGLAIVVDEFYFHHKRGLPPWERVGHPIDTFFYLLTLLFIFNFPYSPFNFKIYLALSVISTLMIIKDELIHFEQGLPHEQFLHALLFILHPLSILSAFLIWPIVKGGNRHLIEAMGLDLNQELLLKLAFNTQALIAFSFFLYQIIYWNIYKRNTDVKS